MGPAKFQLLVAWMERQGCICVGVSKHTRVRVCFCMVTPKSRARQWFWLACYLNVSLEVLLISHVNMNDHKWVAENEMCPLLCLLPLSSGAGSQRRKSRHNSVGEMHMVLFVWAPAPVLPTWDICLYPKILLSESPGGQVWSPKGCSLSDLICTVVHIQSTEAAWLSSWGPWVPQCYVCLGEVRFSDSFLPDCSCCHPQPVCMGDSRRDGHPEPILALFLAHRPRQDELTQMCSHLEVLRKPVALATSFERISQHGDLAISKLVQPLYSLSSYWVPTGVRHHFKSWEVIRGQSIKDMVSALIELRIYVAPTHHFWKQKRN
jgi:hypothetical protein